MERIWFLLYAALAFMLLVLFVALLNRWRLSRKPKMAEEDLLSTQAALLEAIKVASANQRTIVDIGPFWRRSGVKYYQKIDVVQPLIEAGHVTAHATDAGNEFVEVMQGIWNVAMRKAPRFLVLTDRTWTRMVHEGISGTKIVIGSVGVLNNQNAGRDIVHSPQTNAGRDAVVGTGSNSSGSSNEGIDLSLMSDLVKALREDATNLPDQEQRSRLRSLANKIESEVDAEQVDEDAVEDSLARVERYLGRAGGLMSATLKVFNAWRQLHGEQPAGE